MTAGQQDGGQLPIWELVRRAYGYVLHEQRHLVRLALPWLIGAYGLGLVPTLLSAAWREGAWGLAALVDGVGYAAVVVAWARRLVLGEPWPRFAAPLHLPVLRFLLWSFLTMFLVLLPAGLLALVLLLILAGTLPAEPEAAPALGATALVFLLPFGLYLYIHVHLIFVPFARAVDERLGFAASWRLVRGKALRLLAALALVALPLLLLALVGAALLALLLAGGDELPMLPSEGGAVTVTGVLADLALRSITYADAAITATFLAAAYVQLLKRAPACGPGREGG